MSVLIRGMKMPKTCDDCLFQDKEALACKITHSISWEWADDEGCRTISPKPDDCPLVELPPHGRLIDADVLTERLVQGLNNSIGQAHAYYRFAMAWINESQTVIEAEGAEGDGDHAEEV